MLHSKDLEAHYDKIYKYCYYKLPSRELAEDMTQETFLRFLQKKQYHGMESPLKVLYTIAKNLCIDESRKRNVQPLAELENVSEIAASGMEETVLTNHMLQAAMNKLEETERDIVFLHLVNEEPFAVIAGSLTLSRYAVYRRYTHAVGILRKELE